MEVDTALPTPGAELTPRQVVAELDKFIIGQDKAKRAVAVALRNRWRRKQSNQMTCRSELRLDPRTVSQSVSQSVRQSVSQPVREKQITGCARKTNCKNFLCCPLYVLFMISMFFFSN